MARMDADADADAACADSDQAVCVVLSQVHPDHSIRDEVRRLLSPTTSLANTRRYCCTSPARLNWHLLLPQAGQLTHAVARAF